MVDKKGPEVWISGDIIDWTSGHAEPCAYRYRLGIQAFQPVLVEGKHRIHPMFAQRSTRTYGDQMRCISSLL